MTHEEYEERARQAQAFVNRQPPPPPVEIEPTMAVQTVETSVVVRETGPAPLGSAITVAPKDEEFTAENADEMQQCQHSIVAWCRAKVAEMKGQAIELRGAFEKAVKMKWSSSTLKRHADLADKRVSFYEKLLKAVEMGYQIVPSFPISLFAIRTDKKRPMKMLTYGNYGSNKLQHSNSLASGEGEYKNPFPVVFERECGKDEKGNVRKQTWAEAWKDIEFPLSMAKCRIMEAVDRAMALKIFDDFGILPGTANRERVAHADPLIVARIVDPRPPGYGEPRAIMFIIAWHLDTRTL